MAEAIHFKRGDREKKQEKMGLFTAEIETLLGVRLVAYQYVLEEIRRHENNF